MADPDVRVPFVGLTGGIAAGKSEALSALQRLGAATLSTDALVHELLETDEVRERVVDRFGSDVAPDGKVDRTKLGARAFEDPEGRAWLEQELWPRVGARVVRWREELEHAAARPRAAVVEVPLLFESGMEEVFDCTIAVVADEPVRAKRARERGHSGLESRSARQLSQEEKAQRADFTVPNDGSLDDLERLLSQTLATIDP